MRVRGLIPGATLVFFGLSFGCGGEEVALEGTEASSAALVASPVVAGPLVSSSVAPARPVMTTDEKRHLVYEVLVQNTGATPLMVSSLAIAGGEARGPILARYRGADLAAIFASASSATSPGTLAPQEVGVVFVDLVVSCPVPRRLAHVFVTTAADGTATTRAGAVVTVLDEEARPLGPPLHGENLLDLNGCCAGAHTRALFPRASGFVLAQRYAIDFVRVTEEGTSHGDPTRNDSYFLYGADVVAAEGGRIVEAVDGMAENVPTAPLPAFSVEQLPGNHVVEALDDGRFALYAHLQTGSVNVRSGQRVRRGERLGLVGNSGNSTEPHLHFHVTDGPSPLGSNGIPYVFDRFTYVAALDLLSGDVAYVAAPNARRDRLPRGGDVVSFP